MKTGLIITGVLAIAVIGFFAWQKRPKVTINFSDKNGNGSVQIGGKEYFFEKDQGIQTGTWNGYRMSVEGTTGKYRFSRYNKTIESAEKITPYMGGSSYITINHI